jgi:glycosyltransferase involved in cell wall biosynthesis
VIVGDGPARPELEASAPAGVRFLGELRGEKLAAVYAAADVFCFPSTTDTFGQVLLEAAAAGLPAVAVAAGGAAELVIDGRTGLLVAPDDAEAFAAALSALAGSPRRREELGLRARSHALARTWDQSFGELRDAYAAATGRVAPTPPRRSIKA